MIPPKKTSFNGPRFAQCMVLADRNIARARVLEQMYFYALNRWVPIGKQRYTAPPTDRLVWELGLSKRTIYNAISALKRAGVIEVKHKRIRGAKRRCIRLLKNPCNQDIGPEPGKQDEMDGEVHGETQTAPSEVHVLHSNGAPAASIGCMEEHLPNKKKKETNKTHGPETDHAPETGQSPETGACDPAKTFSGEATLLTSTPQSPPPPEEPTTLLPVANYEQLCRGEKVSRLLSVRHGWTIAENNAFAKRYAARLARERVRKGGSNKGGITIWPPIRCRPIKDLKQPAKI